MMFPTGAPTSAQGFAREDGVTLVLFALCMPVFMGIAALVVDVGHGFADKRDLQNAADAAALAASSYLPSTDPAVLTQAQNAAIDYAARNGATITVGDVTFTSTSVTNDTVKITTHDAVPFSFAPALGITSGAVRAHSAAELGTTIGGIGVMPWGVPPPNGGFVFGQQYCLKLTSQGTCSTGTPSNFQIEDVDNTGDSSGSYYSGLIVTGSHTVVHVGDVKNIITGNKAGPTEQGLGCTGNSGRLAGNNQTFSQVIQSTGSGGDDDHHGSTSYTVLDWHSPRLVLIPVIVTVNSSQVRVTGFAVFFIDGCGPKASVVGRFVDTVDPSGIWGPFQAGSDYGTRSIRLVD
jgi:Flp pilus assembly protein TadG